MNSEEFEKVFDETIEKSRKVLVEKASEYATDFNRLHNFHSGSGLTGNTPEQVCWGFAVKHIVSISDMVAADERYEPSKFSLSQWDEKIGDALNYLILLRALIVEGATHFDDLSESTES